MRLSRLLPTLCFMCAFLGLQGQDIHYTLYNMAPLVTNPALTGAYNGSIRVGGIYRSQWYTVENYSTPSFYVDAPVLRGFRDKDWIGVGAMLLQDNVGPLSQTQFSFSGAYHLGLGKRGGTVLTLGAQFGGITRKLDPTDIRTQGTISSDLGGGGLSIDQDGDFGSGGGMMNEDGELTKSFNDISAGLLLRSKLTDATGLELGFALNHIGAPEYNLISTTGGTGGGGEVGGINERDRAATLLIHGQLNTELNEKWSFDPTFMFQTTAKQREINLQAWMGRRINPDVKLNFGLGYRLGDAAKLLLGLEYKDLRAALSYDFTLSSASSLTNTNGGPEIAAYYIFKIYKQPEITPKLLCPQF